MRLEQTVWRIADGTDQRFIGRTWDRHRLIFDQRTGNTHLLTPLALALVEALADGPLANDELARGLLPLDATKDDHETLDQLLDHLACLEIIEAVTAPSVD